MTMGMMMRMLMMMKTSSFHLFHCFCKLTLDMVVDEHLDDADDESNQGGDENR